ncbi:protein of unknown function [Gracilibacillus ureilyticus]|uniref:DUF4184 family protein n=1 Tax=Gracilibacillus ureilyticus TaxID=531814 RepID=A0A1H9VA29_9BACI|nr:DUF4184 family protein [Gracilibacillus ureilyticus]SES18113.1 protein of unknown function [Gracilibacillus ureilyticus]
MPLTFAHPAAVLPFSKNSKYIDFLALVLGSMAPDFEYFLRGRPAGEIGHTLAGFFVFNLPIIAIVYLIYRIAIHRTLFSHLPAVLAVASPQIASSSILLKLIVFLYSAIFGMITHVVWDSFTHLDGFMVRNLSILNYTVDIFNYNIPVFKFLQHGGTIVGITAIIGYMYIRAAKNRMNGERVVSPKQKLAYWSQISIISILIFGVWYLIDKVSIASYGILVVRIIDSALIGLLLVSIYFNYRYGRID